MISEAELGLLRTVDVQASSTATATVLRKVEVADDMGGSTVTFVPFADYECSFGRYPARPVERESTTRVRSISEWYFVFSVDADIRDTDRLVIDPRTFEVVNAGVGSADVVRRVYALEIV